MQFRGGMNELMRQAARVQRKIEEKKAEVGDREVVATSVGDKVKVTLRFRGRELAHPELGMKLLQRVRADFEPIAKCEYEPRMEGRQMIMILAPR